MSLYPHRKQIRLRGFGYSQPGAYFVTICTFNRRCLFGHIEEGAMHLNDAGRLIEEALIGLPAAYPFVSLDEHIVMPNHLHAILSLTADDPAATEVPLPLDEIVRRFKSFTANQYRRSLADHACRPPVALWQSRFHDIIIANERQLDALRLYARSNPMQWTLDSEHPERTGHSTEVGAGSR